MMNHDGPNYYDRGGGGYESADRNRDRMMRGASDRDTWHRAVDDFIDDRRRERDRSPARENRDYRDWKDRRRSDKEGRRGNYKSGGGSPRDDDRNSTGSGRYNRDNSNDSFRDYNNDDSNSRDWYQKKRGDRWNDDNDRKYRGGDYFREDERRNRDRERERSREYSRDSSRTSRGEETRNSSDRRRADDRSSNHSSEDGYDSSETRDSDYERGRSREFGDIDKMSYKDQVPNRTIIIRGLAQHITESDIREDTIKCKLVPKDIRLIRRKHTGTSRGFAFVEFLSTTEAISWMEMKQGELMLKDHYRAVMQYSLQRMENGREVRISDWHCTRCSAHNFKRRDFCYRCGCTRLEGELMEGVEEVCVHPTNTVLLRGLDALTTEENVLQSIQKLSTLPIRSVRIGRDPVMNTSRGVCYIEMNSVVEAVYLHNALLLNPVKVDNKVPVISYCRLHSTGGGGGGSGTTGPGSSSLASAAIAAAQWSHQKNKDEQEGTTSVITAQYTLEDVSKLADYSANLYAKSVAEKTKYFVYYHDYYTKAIQRGEQISLPSSATVAAQAQNDSAPHDESQNEKTTATVVSASATKTPLTEPPDGSGTQAYPTPDVSTYQYDKTSGYYYDPYTTLYYDANSQYFYNQRLQKFLYWDSVKSTYLPAPTVGAVSYAGAVQHPVQAEEEKDDEQKKVKEKEKQSEKDKVKVAKRIAKDMEKWAKTLNHKKEIARQNLITQQASMPAMKTQGAADIGFAVLERKDLAPRSGGSSLVQNEVSASSDNSLVAAYGQGSDSDDDNNDAQEDEKKLTDWNKLACLLCKRQFPSREVLIKHQQLSDLHKQNMESWYKARGLDPTDAQTRSQQYRDRAKERRQKYGEPDHPQPNRLKENYMKARQATISYEEPTKMGLGSDNLGNKLLQKMGWQEGMGLGKKNQGRTSIIETERRSATAGLGTKSVGVVPGPGETYKDCVKKMMKIRYQEIEENAT